MLFRISISLCLSILPLRAGEEIPRLAIAAAATGEADPADTAAFIAAVEELAGAFTQGAFTSSWDTLATFSGYTDHLPGQITDAPGSHEIEIEASDFNDNTASQSYQIEIAGEPGTLFTHDANGNLTKRITPAGLVTYDWDALTGQNVLLELGLHEEEFSAKLE